MNDAVIDQLARTKGWTRFVSVMLWIAVGFMTLAGIIMFIIGIAGGSMGGSMRVLAGGAGMGILMGGLYLVMAGLYAYPAMKLGNYSSRITDLLQDPTESNLVAALNEQRCFWKYVGIAIIVYFGVVALIFVGALIVTMVAGASA